MINMKIAVIGDFHIPSRKSKTPREIKKKLKQFKPDLILCTGDLTSKKTLKELEEVAEVKIVQGNMDKGPYPEEIEQEVKGKKIVMIHGSQVTPRGNEDQLKYLAKEKDADIMISGHTHQLNVEKTDEVLLLNPGSATGAWSGGGANPKPSFLALDIKDNKTQVKKVYVDKKEEEKYEFN